MTCIWAYFHERVFREIQFIFNHELFRVIIFLIAHYNYALNQGTPNSKYFLI